MSYTITQIEQKFHETYSGVNPLVKGDHYFFNETTCQYQVFSIHWHDKHVQTHIKIYNIYFNIYLRGYKDGMKEAYNLFTG